MPAISRYIIEPIWEQFHALLPERRVDHPLGCHRPRVPDYVVFEKLVQILVFGCAYWRIADEDCSATTLRRRRDEWIEIGVMDDLEQMAREPTIGLSASIFSMWPSIAASLKPRAEERRQAGVRWTGPSKASNVQWRWTRMASPLGRWLLRRTAMTRRFWVERWRL